MMSTKKINAMGTYAAACAIGVRRQNRWHRFGLRWSRLDVEVSHATLQSRNRSVIARRRPNPASFLVRLQCCDVRAQLVHKFRVWGLARPFVGLFARLFSGRTPYRQSRRQPIA
jgi:hypothetical protein